MDKEDDPKLEAYFPFRAFSRYLMAKGFGGVAYRSTRMALIGLQGKCDIMRMFRIGYCKKDCKINNRR